MERLTAVRPILYQAHLYQAGEELPTNQPEVVELWIQYQSAGWRSEEEPTARAGMAAAPPGISGAATPKSEEGERMGVPPKTGRRRNA